MQHFVYDPHTTNVYLFIFQSRLTATYLIGGLGVEDKKNGIGEVQILQHVISRIFVLWAGPILQE